VVEHNLAKVGVESSNLFARSILQDFWKNGTMIISRMGGRSSVVEHNLAKVGVESSNLFARSILDFSEN
jgi:hypothetical protein